MTQKIKLRRSNVTPTPSSIEFGELVFTDVNGVKTLFVGGADDGVNTIATTAPTYNIADGSVTTAKLADASVTAIKLASDSVETSKIVDGNITTAKLADASVTLAKLKTVGNLETGSANVITIISGDNALLSTVSIDINQSNATTDGYLSSADWNTFNNKEGALTAGTISQYYRGDKTWATLDNTAVGLGNVTNDAQLKRDAGDFTTFTSKSGVVNADIILIEDSEASGVKKSVSVENLFKDVVLDGGLF